MGSKIQDCPEVCWQNLGSRLKPIEPIEISIGTKIQAPIEISIGLIGFNRHTDVESVWMCLDNLTVYACVYAWMIMWTCLWSVCRLKPIKPIEISIGDGIQDPRLSRGLLAESWIPIETD